MPLVSLRLQTFGPLAISEILQLHATEPPLFPEFGPVRPRNRDAYRKEVSIRDTPTPTGAR